MNDTKNRVVLYHQEQSFIIYQDKHDKWVYTYGSLTDVNSQSKDLQTALNLVHETIEESVSFVAKKGKGKKKSAKEIVSDLFKDIKR